MLLDVNRWMIEQITTSNESAAKADGADRSVWNSLLLRDPGAALRFSSCGQSGLWLFCRLIFQEFHR